MHEADIRAVVAETLSEQQRLHREELDALVLRTIATILTSFGIEEEDRRELRADFQHLHRWRKSVEQAEKRKIFGNPLHPYTQALLSAVPLPNPRVKRQKRILQGDVPSPMNPPPGCPFHTRCPHAFEPCKTIAPAFREVAPGHEAACHLYGVVGAP